jgi:hypothetical protein
MDDEVSLDVSLKDVDSDNSVEDVDELGEAEGEEITEKALADGKNEEVRFLEQSWEEKWKGVMELLATGKARWDESVDSHADLLEDYKKEILNGRDDRDKTTPTILHMLAKNLYADNFKNVPDDILQKIILYLLQHRESTSLTSETKDLEEDPILKVAMMYDNDRFIDYILTLAPLKLPDLLDARDAAQLNCLHYAFKVQLHKAIPNVPRTRRNMQAVQAEKATLGNTLKMLYKFVSKAKAETIAAIDREGNTPVHYALDYELCSMKSKAETYYQIVRHLIHRSDQVRKKMPANEFNLKDESPYLYFLRTKKEWLGKNEKPPCEVKSTIKLPEKDTKSGVKEVKEIKEPEVIHKVNNDDAKMDSPQPLEKGAKMPGAIAPLEYQGASEAQVISSISQSQRREKPTTASGAKRLNPSQSHPVSRSVPLMAGEVSPSAAQASLALFKANNTPPEPLARRKTGAPAQSSVAAHRILPPKSQIPESEKQSAPSTSNAKTRDPGEVAEEIRDFLKIHYIRTRSEMEAKELLYGKVASGKTPFIVNLSRLSKT